LQATTSAVVEIAAGSALVAGAATPLSAAAVVGTLGVATRSVHAGNGFFVINEGWEFVMNLSVASVALAALGAGPLSVDRALGLEPRLSGTRAAAFAVGVGIAGAAAQLAVFWRRPVPVPPTVVPAPVDRGTQDVPQEM
jgi:putative oxidoreductase